MAKEPKDTKELEEETMPKEVPAAFNTAREGAMEAIVAKRKEELEEEGVSEPVVEPPEPDPEVDPGVDPDAPPAEPVIEPVIEPEPTDLPPGITMEDGQMYATVVVDGQQIVKPIGDVMSDYQMKSASNKRMQEAADDKKEAEEWVSNMQAEIARRDAAPDMDAVMARRAKLQAEADEAFLESDVELTNQKRQELFNLDREIFKADQPAQAAPVDVQAQVTKSIKAEREEREAEAQELAIETGWNWMKTNHPDIMAIEGADYKNEDLNDLWQRKVEREEQKNPYSSPQQIFELAANSAKKAMGIAKPRTKRRDGLPNEPISGSPADLKDKDAGRSDGSITDAELEGIRSKAIKKMMDRGQPQAR